MKMTRRLLALFLALTMLLLAGCGSGGDSKEKDKEDDLFADVKDKLDELYTDDGETLVLYDDLELETVLRVDGEKYTISWEIKDIEGESGECFIEEYEDVSCLVFDSAVSEDVFVTLKATIKNSDKDKDTYTVEVLIPGPGYAPDNGGNSNSVDVSEVTTDISAEITFTHTMGQSLQNILDQYIDEFNEIYPNIKIDHSSAGSWGDINGQINTEIAGGCPPNIAYCYPDHVAMYNIAKAAVVLDDLIASDVEIEGWSGEILGLTDAQKSDFVTAFYNEGKVYGDGKMYTLPLSKSTEVLYYNKTFFEEHGLSVPTTWDEMWDVCAKIKEIDPACYPLGYDDEANWFITMCEQMDSGYISAENGGEYLFDNAENQAFVKELREYYQKGYFTTQELYGSYLSNLFVETQDTNCYMCIGSSGGAAYQMSNMDTADGSYAFEVGVTAIPQVAPSNPKAMSQGPNLCILKGSNTTDEQVIASWLFVKFLATNAEFQAVFSMTCGYMPVIKSASQNATYQQWLSKGNGKEYLVAQVVKTSINNFSSYFVPPAFNGSVKARDVVGDLLMECLADPSKDIDQAFADAIEECEY